MKLLVTGGAGFVGSHVAEQFSKDGAEVVVCDNLSRAQTLGKVQSAEHYNWNYLMKNFPGVKLLNVDVRNFTSLREASKSSTAIIHTAGQVAVTASLADPRTDFEVNAVGTFNALESARLNDSSFVFCSTNKVYGENVNTIPVDRDQSRYVFSGELYQDGIPENFPLDHTKHSPYGTSKLAADLYVQEYARTYGLKTCVFRMSCIYGERQFGVEDQGWLSWFIIATLTGKPLTIYGDGKQVRDVLYVKDLVDAFKRFLDSDIKHEVFNMGGGPMNSLSLLELVERLKQLSGMRPTIKYGDWRQADQKVYISDIRKAKQLLGWIPTVGPKEGTTRLVRWVEANKDLFMSAAKLSPED